MKYLLLIGDDPSVQAAGQVDEQATMKEYMDFTQAIIASGEMVGGERLHGVDAATSVRVRNGKTTATDGPFAETKEHLGGYYVVDVADLDRAIELAGRIPSARTGVVEVRPIHEM
jgi:hypothetical protein